MTARQGYETRPLFRSLGAHCRRIGTGRRALDQTLVGNARRKYAVQRCNEPALLRLQRRAVVDGTGSGISHAELFDIQAGTRIGRMGSQGERGTKVYFVKQLEIREDAGDDASTRLIPMMREHAQHTTKPLRAVERRGWRHGEAIGDSSS
jgi:hypothetical protein